MKELILIRHAKSSWEHQVTDFERPLKGRGIKDARMISNHIRNKIIKPDLILSSDANRAKSTAKIFLDILDFNDTLFHLNHNLYDFSIGKLIQEIKNCDDSVDSLMLFGHNHAITAFACTFGSRYFDNVPTCGLVHIRFNINSWKDLNQGETLYTVFPKDLK